VDRRDGRDESMRPPRCAQGARVGDYVSMSNSEFRRWTRGGSNHFWRNSVAIFSNSLPHTALDFANGMMAEDTNPKEAPIADEVGRAEAWPGISREMVPAIPR
jgi:hypothetical protein